MKVAPLVFTVACFSALASPALASHHESDTQGPLLDCPTSVHEWSELFDSQKRVDALLIVQSSKIHTTDLTTDDVQKSNMDITMYVELQGSEIELWSEMETNQGFADGPITTVMKNEHYYVLFGEECMVQPANQLTASPENIEEQGLMKSNVDSNYVIALIGASRSELVHFQGKHDLEGEQVCVIDIIDDEGILYQEFAALGGTVAPPSDYSAKIRYAFVIEDGVVKTRYNEADIYAHDENLRVQTKTYYSVFELPPLQSNVAKSYRHKIEDFVNSCPAADDADVDGEFNSSDHHRMLRGGSKSTTPRATDSAVVDLVAPFIGLQFVPNIPQ